MKKKIYCSVIFFLFIGLAIFTTQSLTQNDFQPPTADRGPLEDRSLALPIQVTPEYKGTIGDDDMGWISGVTTVCTRQRDNQPPFVPHDPIPENESINQPLVIFLLWLGGDPDPEDIVTYDVYFGASNPPPKVISNQTLNNYIPGVLDYDTTYYWKIVSWDNNGAYAVGPLWHFTSLQDTTPPVTTPIFKGIMGNNGWYTSDVSITLHALDNQSGVDNTYYKLEDESEWIEYTQPFYVEEDGAHFLLYYSVDKKGNEEDVKNATLKIDQTVPTITLTVTSENTPGTKWLLNATVTDTTSGVAKVNFCIDDVLIGNVTTPGPYVWLYEGHGKKAQAIVYDMAGNGAMSAQITMCELNVNTQSMLCSGVLFSIFSPQPRV